MTDSNPHRRGDELLADIIAGTSAPLANELLKECFHGYPVERLTVLLRSDDESLVKKGVWIASELAREAKPLLSDIMPLLDYPAAYVKSYAIDVVLMAASDEDGEMIAHTIMLIADDDQRIRWQATHFLARADREQLAAAVTYVTDQEIAAATLRLLNEEGQPISSVEILHRLNDDNRTVRLFALSTAARTREDDPSTLLAATDAKDEEVRSMATRLAREFRMIPRA